MKTSKIKAKAAFYLSINVTHKKAKTLTLGN